MSKAFKCDVCKRYFDDNGINKWSFYLERSDYKEIIELAQPGQEKRNLKQKNKDLKISGELCINCFNEKFEFFLPQ